MSDLNPNLQLPERASLEYLKKLAKDRLQEMRRADPRAKLAVALFDVAREHGFASWRALKVELDRRRLGDIGRFFEACASGDVETLRGLLARDAGLVRLGKPPVESAVTDVHGFYGGWTGLHSAAHRGHVNAVRLLLEHGADPNAREEGDNTYPLHWAVAHGHLETARTLLDAGGDVHGFGDLHKLDVIGWATFFHPDDREDGDPDVIALLIERGARHHIFSVLSIGDLGLIREVVEANPELLDRRMSDFEQGQTPLHFAINRKRYDVLDLLIELGADLEAVDKNRQTALAKAMLTGDGEAIQRLHAAGAKEPDAGQQSVGAAAFREGMAKLADSVTKHVPMIFVPDVGRALDWYVSIGFTELARYGEKGVANFGVVSFGKAELMLNMNGKAGDHDATFWFHTDKVDDVYQLCKSRQLGVARAMLSDGTEQQGIEFVQHIEDMFYGARQFGIRDLNGYVLYFIRPVGGASPVD